MKLRIAFLGSRRFEPQVPQRLEWGEAAFFPIAQAWRPAVADACAFRPDVTFVFEPFGMPAPEIDSLPATRVGIVTQQPTPDELRETGRRQRSGAGALDWFTWFEEPTPSIGDLPLLAVVGALLDMQRLPNPPAVERVGVAVPSWARPPDVTISAELLPSGSDPLQIREALSRYGILLYHSTEPLRLSDPALVLALGHGQLVISNQAFPVECGFEEEDEYLVRPVKKWPKIIEKEQEGLGYFRAVRVRAWQKVRELFDASTLFQRLANDALLLKGDCRTSPSLQR